MPNKRSSEKDDWGQVNNVYTDDSRVINEMTQDVEPIIEHNQSISNLMDKSEFHKHSIYKVGSIPNVIVHAFLNNGINLYSSDEFNANEACKYILSHPSMKKFKCYNGSLSRAKIPHWLKTKIDSIIGGLKSGYN